MQAVLPAPLHYYINISSCGFIAPGYDRRDLAPSVRLSITTETPSQNDLLVANAPSILSNQCECAVCVSCSTSRSSSLELANWTQTGSLCKPAAIAQRTHRNMRASTFRSILRQTTHRDSRKPRAISSQQKHLSFTLRIFVDQLEALGEVTGCLCRPPAHLSLTYE